MFHKYLHDIIKKERCYFPNWFRKKHLVEHLGIEISIEDWDTFIEWYESKSNNDLIDNLTDYWEFFNEEVKEEVE
jgi:hypothetical protein